MNDYFNYFCALIGAAFGWFFGDSDGIILALLAMTFIDYITGVIAGGIQHKLSSRVGFKGIAKKLVIFVLVGVAHVIDYEFLGQTAVLRDAVILFFCANEGISILENADVIGVPIPDKLRNLFLSMKDNKHSHF